MKFASRFYIKVAWILIGIGFVLLVMISLSHGFNDWSFEIDTELAERYGEFVGGLVGTIFSLAAVFLLFSTYYHQKSQTEILRDQIHTDSFFKATGNFYEFRNRIEYSKGRITIVGEEEIGQKAIQNLMSEFRSFTLFPLLEGSEKSNEELLKEFYEKNKLREGRILLNYLLKVRSLFLFLEMMSKEQTNLLVSGMSPDFSNEEKFFVQFSDSILGSRKFPFDLKEKFLEGFDFNEVHPDIIS